MAVNKPRIAGKPATERRRVRGQTIEPKPVPPTQSYVEINSEGNPVNVLPVSPDRAGQLYFQVSSDDDGNRGAIIYVAVDIGGTLEWKQVNAATYLNLYTGRPYDPIYD